MADKPTNRERLQEITAGIEQGIKELFESEKYRRYLSVMSKFHRYSVNNTMLIYMQKPDATLVAGYNKWQQFERHVKRGEHGITIIAPTPYKKKIEEQKLDPDTHAPILDADGKAVVEEKEIEIPMFRPVKVFDLSQTDGKPLPELASALSGTVPHYEAFLEAMRRSAPVPIEFEPMADDIDGYFSPDQQRIAIREGMSEVQTVSTIVHETAHSKLHDYDKAQEEAARAGNKEPPNEKDRNTKEVEAESISYAVCQYFGIQTGENSFGYIASWSKDKELKELRTSLEIINKTSCELINDIERNYKEICKERGIDLTAQQEQPAAEMEAPTQVPVRHEYKLHDNFERTSPADGTYIQEYTVAEDLSLTPGEVLYTGTYGECTKLYAALQDGSMTAKQVKDQTKMEKLYELDERLYLHIQPCEDGYDYTIYDKDTMRALDGGQLDAPQLPIAKACLEICNLHNIGTHTIAYAPLEMVETLQEAQLSQPPLPPEPPEHHLDEYPMPDPVLTQDDLEKCGYLDGDLLPLSKERAYELMERDLTVYMIQQGENPEMAFDTADLDAHDGIFAVSREEWEESPEFDKLVKDRMNHQQEREQAFLSHKGDCYAIYQVKHTDELRDIRYEGLEWLQSIGRTVQRDNYELVYTAPLLPSDLKGDTTEQLFYRFNNEHPADYGHPSMSVSDIVAIKQDGKVSCHYCDSFGFTDVPGFLSDNPMKNAEMAVEDDYGMIDGVINNGSREPTVAQLEQQARSGQPISLMDLAAATHREERDKKKSVMEQLKSQPRTEHKKKAPQKSAEREI